MCRRGWANRLGLPEALVDITGVGSGRGKDGTSLTAGVRLRFSWYDERNPGRTSSCGRSTICPIFQVITPSWSRPRRTTLAAMVLEAVGSIWATFGIARTVRVFVLRAGDDLSIVVLLWRRGGGSGGNLMEMADMLPEAS